MSRTPGYLQSLYRWHVRKFGGSRSPTAKNKAAIAVAHKLSVIIWHVLATGKPYTDLGADYLDRRVDPGKETRRLIAKLQALGHTVTIEPPGLVNIALFSYRLCRTVQVGRV